MPIAGIDFPTGLGLHLKYSLSTQFSTGCALVAVNCATRLSIRFQLLMKNKMLKNKNYSCIQTLRCFIYHTDKCTGPRSAVGNVSGNRCESDCRSRGREFDPGPVPYFRGD